MYIIFFTLNYCIFSGENNFIFLSRMHKSAAIIYETFSHAWEKTR